MPEQVQEQYVQIQLSGRWTEIMMVEMARAPYVGGLVIEEEH
jgi:hypothetical protein